jgi:hypothetical protein
LTAFKYLSVGIIEHCDFFIDFSLIQFVGEKFQTSQSLCFLVQLLSYFPGKSRLLNFFFFQTLSQSNLSYSQRFLLFQVNQVRQLRQSSASLESTQKLIETKSLAKMEYQWM